MIYIISHVDWDDSEHGYTLVEGPEKIDMKQWFIEYKKEMFALDSTLSEKQREKAKNKAFNKYRSPKNLKDPELRCTREFANWLVANKGFSVVKHGVIYL